MCVIYFSRNFVLRGSADIFLFVYLFREVHGLGHAALDVPGIRYNLSMIPRTTVVCMGRRICRLVATFFDLESSAIDIDPHRRTVVDRKHSSSI